MESGDAFDNPAALKRHGRKGFRRRLIILSSLATFFNGFNMRNRNFLSSLSGTLAERKFRFLPRALLMTVLAGSLLAGGPVLADPGIVTVHTEKVTQRFKAYARVEPVAVLPIRAAQAGMVDRLEIRPGAAVQAGQELAVLGGSEIQAQLAQKTAVVKSARTSLRAARKSLAIERQQHASHLATQQMVLQAQAAAAQAQSHLDRARAQLRALRGNITLTTPAAGRVLAVKAAAGQRVSIGETLLVVQPAHKLWLRASYYGADAAALRAGMTGRFLPAGGGNAIPVKVTAVFGTLRPDGGESVGLLAGTPAPGWLNGESGTVILNGSARLLVVVPTRALILDRGQWWVLVHTDQGNRRQAVRPGPARGWRTFIESGLKAGEQVVVANAYLEFHRGISKSYQPPD